MLDTQNFVAAIPGTSSIVRMANGELDTLENEDGRSASIVELDMVSLDSGWAKAIDASCATTSVPGQESSSVSCSSTSHLLQTTDGGITWQIIDLPALPSRLRSSPLPRG
jgi:hypothetical protein